MSGYVVAQERLYLQNFCPALAEVKILSPANEGAYVGAFFELKINVFFISVALLAIFRTFI